MRLAVLVLLSAACGKDESGATQPSGGSPAPAPQPRSAPEPAQATVDAAPKRPGPTLAELPNIDDVPAIALARPSGAKIAGSIRLNKQGYALHRAKDFAKAAAKYREAVVQDPGNLLARYNLACALASGGEFARGLAVLAQFKIPDCRACAGILSHAKTDPEWAPHRATAAFADLTAGAGPDEIPREQLARKLVALVTGKGSTDGLAPYFHPRDGLRLTLHRKHTFETFATPRALQRWGKQARAEADPYIRVPEKFTCDDTCCRFRFGPDEVEGSDTAYDLEAVCFEGVGGVRFASRIDFSSYLAGLSEMAGE